ncbi:MAG: GNAT family N-acetyltransferase [Halochromatium sp.]|uniref:GNAT family N-acetyltransferase n=1 Tax=Halochromatium sp. TaxID=2049430 RepID=UPI003978484B
MSRLLIDPFKREESMWFSTDTQGREEAIIELFRATFTASEGAEEGSLIGNLVQNLLASTAAQDRFAFMAEDDGAINAGIFFSRLTYEQDERAVFVLAPVAVATDQQGKGIGQRLLNQGLATLRSAGVDIAMTYGDPGYYTKVGFRPISEADAPAPFKLSRPEGWLALSLTDRAMTPLKGPSRCVEALNDPVFW